MTFKDYIKGLFLIITAVTGMCWPCMAAERNATSASWLPGLYDRLHFLITPSTINKDEIKWTVSNDGRYALSSGADIILWDILLCRPLIVYPGVPSTVRFSEYSPHIIYTYETDGWWALRNMYTAEIKGFFKDVEIPAESERLLPEAFFEKIYSENASNEFTDMDISPQGTVAALAGPIPMVWNIKDGEPHVLVSRRDTTWMNALYSKGMKLISPKFHTETVFSPYWNVRCTFGSDSTLFFSLPEEGIHVFDTRGYYLRHIDTKGVITQLRQYHGDVVAERLYDTPAIYKPGWKTFRAIKSRKGYELPFEIISEISDDGYFIGAPKSNWDNFTIGQLRSDGTARWRPLNSFPARSGPTIRVYMSKSGRWFSFSGEFESALYLNHILPDDDMVSSSTFVMSHDSDFKRACQPYSGAFIRDSVFVAGSVYGMIFIGNSAIPDVINEHQYDDRAFRHQGAVIGVKAIDDHRFATADSYGTVKIYDSTTFELLVTMVYFPLSGDYIVYTPDNYYKATKGATDRIHYVQGLNSFTFRQFDLKYNRPDIILERLGGDEHKIKILRSAWEKRIRRMGFDREDIVSAESHAPELIITNRDEITGSLVKDKVTLSISAEDTVAALKSLHVLINDVPIYGTKGKNIGNRGTYNGTVELALGEGVNHITVYCLNTNGQESLHHQVVVENNVPAEYRRLYVAAVGVSEYDDDSQNLQFAASDARSLAKAFENNNGKFTEVKTMVIENGDFNKDSLAKLRAFLNQTSRNDVAILYYAGHGVLDASLNYYLGCTATDFVHPEKSSVRYEDFQDVLDAIPSLHRYCIVDACHSGDIDKDEALAVNTMPIAEYGELRFRSTGRHVISTVNREVARQYHSMFVDLSQKSGITVVASSNGDELSMESPEYGGGLFTCALTEALSGLCDSDTDGNITSSELLEYARTRVATVSSGLQNPQIKYNEMDKEVVMK